MRTRGFERIARLVGDTPLVEISQSVASARILAKLEYYNPSGSVKDRAAKAMLEAALAAGVLAGRTILEATSGNTGIALAMFGSALGLPVELVMPANVTAERKRIIANYGARSIFTSNLEGTDGAQRRAAALAGAHPERYFYPDQYNNEHNWRAHYGATGPEIWRQSHGAVTHFVAGLGTSGTLMGVGTYLKEQNPDVQVLAVEPPAGETVDGLRSLDDGFIPPVYDKWGGVDLLDGKRIVRVEESVAQTRRLASAGVFAGLSAGAALAGAMRVAERAERAVVVFVVADGGWKYLSSRAWTGDLAEVAARAAETIYF